MRPMDLFLSGLMFPFPSTWHRTFPNVQRKQVLWTCSSWCRVIRSSISFIAGDIFRRSWGISMTGTMGSSRWVIVRLR